MSTSEPAEHPPKPERTSSTGNETAAAARKAGAAVDTRSLDSADRLIPTWTESVAYHASRMFGGALGRHAQVGRQWFWTPLRVILLLATLMLAAGWLFKAPCAQSYDTPDGPRLDWRDNRQYTAMCYSDIIPRYGMGDLAGDHAFPYKTPLTQSPGAADETARYMEYPVFTGLFQWVNAKITDGWSTLAANGWLPGGVSTIIYFNMTTLWLSAAWLTTVWALVKQCRPRVWDAALAAISPLAFVHVFTNFDAVATAFGTVGLLAWARRRPVLAGVLIGLGATAKLYPLFFLGPLLLLCFRAGRVMEAARAVLGAGAAWLAVNMPILLLYPAGWAEFFRLNTARPADPDSLYNVVAYFTGWSGFDGPLAPNQAPTVLNAVSVGLFALACVGVAWLALAAPSRPRLAQLCFLVVAAFLLTNKVWSPQYSLWLVPLAVLAIPRWRLLLTWMTIDALVWVPRMYYYLGTANKGLPEGWFLGAVVLRDAVLALLCVLIVREILAPGSDAVRSVLPAPSRRGLLIRTDLSGGFLDEAPDRFVLPGLARWGHSPLNHAARKPGTL